jgi:hypothetical protein
MRTRQAPANRLPGITVVSRPEYSQLPFCGNPVLVAFQRYDEEISGSTVENNGKTKAGGEALFDTIPRVPSVRGAEHPLVVLPENAVRVIGVLGKPVYAIADILELIIFYSRRDSVVF